MGVGDVAFWISLLGLLVLATLDYARNRSVRQFLSYLTLLTVCGVVYAAFFQSDLRIQSKGAHSNELSFIIILYAFMLVGMGSHYLYNLLMKPASARPPFDLGRFFAPIFASPIVFIPLLGAFQGLDIDLSNLTLPKYMVFLVAFENGFFWKELVDNRTKGQRS